MKYIALFVIALGMLSSCCNRGCCSNDGYNGGYDGGYNRGGGYYDGPVSGGY